MSVGQGVASKYYSGFSPLQIGDCALWLDADDSSTFTLSGSSVATWADKSGNSRNATLATGSVTYSSSARGLSFNGSSYYTLPNSTFPTGNSNYSMFIVSSSTLANYHWIIANGVQTAGQAIGCVYYPTGAIENGWWTSNVVTAGGVVSANQRALIECIYTSPALTTFVNGTSKATSSSLGTRNNPAGPTLIGARMDSTTSSVVQALVGTINEILIFAGGVSDVQRQQIEGYLAWKWGIRGNLSYSLPNTISGCALWLDAADSSTLTLSGSNVTQWRDKINSTTFTASSTNPTISTTTYGVQPAIQFGGSAYFSNGSFTYTIATHSTFVVVGETSTHTNNAGILAFGTSGTDYNRTNAKSYNTSYGPNNAYFEIDQGFQAGGFAVAFGANTPTPFAVYNDTFGAGSLFGYMNGTQSTTITNAATFSSSTGLLVGARSLSGVPSTPITGVIAEVILFSRVLTTTERQQVEGYLAAKWGLQGSLPAGHPYAIGIPTTHPYYSRVPISRPFAPVDVSGCALWLDAADPTTVTLSGSNVTRVRDKSSNAYLLSNGTGFTYPNNSFNGTSNPSFLCAGSLSNVLGINTSFSATQPLVTFIVGQPTFGSNTGKFPYLVDSTNSSSRIALYYWSSNGYRTRMYAGGEIEYTGTSSGAFLHSYVANTTSSAIFTDGTSRVTGSIGTGTLSGIKIGNTVTPNSSTAWVGHICEVLIYNGSLTTFQRQQVEGYLARKWGLVGSAPSLTVFSPLQISGCRLWLDAADSSTMTLSGSNVAQWNDKSGNNTNAIQNTALNRPTYVSNVVSNLPGISFSNTSAQGTQSLSVTFNPTSTNSITVFAVVRPILSYPASGNPDFVIDGADFSVYTMSWNKSTNNYLLYIYNTGGNSVGVTLISSNAYIFGSTYGSSTETPYLNGTAYSTRTNTGTALNATRTWNLGTNAFSGHFHEFLVYNSVLTTTQRQQIEGYLALKWGLQGSLPSTHPYAIRGLPTSHPMRTRVPLTTSFDPRQISNCALWLDAADSTTIILSNSNVTQWNDKSGSGFNLSQSTTGNRPTYSNGVVNFNAASSNFMLNTSTNTFGATGTVFAVLSLTSLTGMRALSIGNGTTFISVDSFSAGAYYNNTSGYYASSNQLVSTVGNRHTRMVQRSGATTPRYTVNGGTLTNMETSDVTVSATSQITVGTGGSYGTNFYMTGHIAEIIGYTSYLSTDDIRRVEGYLAWKWGLQGPPPATYIVPFTPTQISGSTLWLDGADSNSMILSGSNVSQWSDKSGSNNHATQSTAGQRPTFTGSGIAFSRSSSTNLAISVPYPTSFTFFMVATTSSSIESYYLGRSSSGGGGPTIIANYTGSSIEYFNSSDRATFAATPTSTFLVSFTQQQGGRIVGYYNGSSVFDIAQTITTSPGVAWSTLGNSYLTTYTNYITGTLYEILIYPSLLTTGDRQNIEGYLALKWGLQGSLPATHPYANRGLPSSHAYKTISPI